MKNKYLPYIAAIASFCTVLIGCYEPRGGCLDPNAVNFDVNADLDTGCIYPSLVLNMSHLHGTEGIKTDSIYFNQLNQAYQVKEFAFYLSGFTFLSGNQAYTLQDTFHAFQLLSPSANDSSLITPISDIGLIRRSTINPKIGTFREVGVFDGIECDFGLRQELISILPGSVRVGFPLRPQAEMLYDSIERSYRFARLIVEHDSGPVSVIDTLYLSGAEFAAGENHLKQIVPLKQHIGYDFKVNLAIDYKKWFDLTDFNQSKNDIQRQIAISIPASFTFSQ